MGLMSRARPRSWQGQGVSWIPRPGPQSLKSFRFPCEVQSPRRRPHFALYCTNWSSKLQPGAHCRTSQQALDFRGVVPLGHLRHVPPDSMATLV